MDCSSDWVRGLLVQRGLELGAMSLFRTALRPFNLSANCEEPVMCLGFVNRSLNCSSGDNETVITGWSRRGVMDRVIVWLKYPDSVDEDPGLGGSSPEETTVD